MAALYNTSEVISAKVHATMGCTAANPSISTVHIYFDNNPT